MVTSKVMGINGNEWDLMGFTGIYPTWLWLTVRHGISMALIEIDGEQLGFPNLKMVIYT